ncbi:MAG: glycerol-3-phosphate acyltransferase [Dehalococcoidia bacterium]
MEDPSIQALVLVALGSYVIGSFPTAYVVVRRFTGRNVMEYGTGNVGTMNTLRSTNSKTLTLIVLLGDIGKGGLALLLGYLVSLGFDYTSSTTLAVAGITAVVGHNYSVFLKLKGGKGLATAAPVLLYLEPVLCAVWIGVFLLTVLVSRLMVMGQISGTVAAPLLGLVFFYDSVVPVGILSAIVFIRHAPRLKNIVKGTEPRMYYRIREGHR